MQSIKIINREGTEIPDAQLLVNGIPAPFSSEVGGYIWETSNTGGPYQVQINAPGYLSVAYQGLPYVPSILYLTREHEDFFYSGWQKIPCIKTRDQIMVILKHSNAQGAIDPATALSRFEVEAQRLGLRSRGLVVQPDPDDDIREPGNFWFAYAYFVQRLSGEPFLEEDPRVAVLRSMGDLVEIAGPAYLRLPDTRPMAIGGHTVRLTIQEGQIEAVRQSLKSNGYEKVNLLAEMSQITMVVELPLGSLWNLNTIVEFMQTIRGVKNVELENWPL